MGNKGEGGVKKSQKMDDIIYGWPLRCGPSPKMRVNFFPTRHYAIYLSIYAPPIVIVAGLEAF